MPLTPAATRNAAALSKLILDEKFASEAIAVLAIRTKSGSSMTSHRKTTTARNSWAIESHGAASAIVVLASVFAISLAGPLTAIWARGH
jgi:hypothetical protein